MRKPRKEGLVGFLIVISTIFISASQFLSSTVTDDLIKAVGKNAIMLQTRNAMNEYLIRYLISGDVANSSKRYYVTQAVPYPTFHIETNEVNITAWFDKEGNLQYYFNETGALNSERPEVERVTWQLLGIDPEIRIKLYSSSILFYLGIALLAVASLVSFDIILKTKE